MIFLKCVPGHFSLLLLLWQNLFLFSSSHYTLAFLNFFFLFLFLSKDNCFTEFFCFLSNLDMNQPSVYIYPFSLEPSSYVLTCPTPPGVTEPWFEFPQSYSKFPLATYFAYGSICVSVLLFPFVPSSPSPTPFFYV